MISALHCPSCHAEFKTVCIEDGYIKCPECKTVIFQYRFPGEESLTPKEFMKLLDTRGGDAVRQSRKWFRGKFALAAAGVFVPYVWTFLAKTFVKPAEEEAPS